MRRACLAGALLLAGACSLMAQTDSARVVRDTTIVIAPSAADSAARPDSVKEFHPTKSPWLAVALSAAVPGAGQIYDASYWKAPVIWGFTGFWIAEWIQQNNKYKDYSGLYDASLRTSSGGNEQYRTLRDFYRDDRDRFAWFLGGLYFLNLVDAYVGAHLYDFDVSPELSADGRIVPKVTASLCVRF